MMREYEHEYADFLYYTPRELDKEGSIWPVRAGRSIAKPNYSVGPKRIECYSLHFVEEGKVCVEFDGSRAQLQQGDLFCLFPGRTYNYRMLPADATLQMRWIALDGDRVRPLLERAGLKPEMPVMTDRYTGTVKQSVEQLIHALAEAQKWTQSRSLRLYSLVYALFAGLIPDSPVPHTAKPVAWIRECMDFMELHATEGITVQQVADFAGVHRSYFSGVFTAQVGISPVKYILNIRMEKAQRLLRETDATITEIALSLGYPSLYTFTRAFKNCFNVSPLAVRKRNDRSASTGR